LCRFRRIDYRICCARSANIVGACKCRGRVPRKLLKLADFAIGGPTSEVEQRVSDRGDTLKPIDERASIPDAKLLKSRESCLTAEDQAVLPELAFVVTLQ
jgi:hypothetical protein